MVEFCIITGEVDNNRIRVQTRTGARFWATMAVVGNNVSLPSEKWITSNRKNFLALVAFEKDSLDGEPMVMGFYPVRGASSKDYDNFELLLTQFKALVSCLQKATVMTRLGPQRLMSTAQTQLTQISSSLDDIDNNLLKLRL